MANRILVVDDEAEIADLIEAYLTGENYTVFKFYSATEALACINTTELDLAILDVMMPEIDGFALCQKIREKHTWPIIMLTAKDENGQNCWADPGGRRLCDKAFSSSGTDGEGEIPTAPVSQVQSGSFRQW